MFASTHREHAGTLGTIYQVGSGTATPLTTAVLAPQGLAFGTNGRLLAVSGSPSNPLIASIDPKSGGPVIG